MEKITDRIIVALDTLDPWRARSLIEELTPVTTFKVGHYLALSAPSETMGLADLIDYDYWANDSTARRNKTNFFIDFKYLDIPRTVAAAVGGLTSHRNITMCTVHAARSVMDAAVPAAGQNLKILAVPLLTSFDDDELWDFFREPDLVKFFMRRVDSAIKCGCHGIICPPVMVALVRRHVPDDFLIVSPGIRLEGSPSNDHKNPGTPRQVIADGADYIVVGDPVIMDKDPIGAFNRIVDEINQTNR